MKDQLWTFKDLKSYLQMGNQRTRKIGKDSGALLVVSAGIYRYDPATVKKYMKEAFGEKSSA